MHSTTENERYRVRLEFYSSSMRIFIASDLAPVRVARECTKSADKYILTGSQKTDVMLCA